VRKEKLGGFLLIFDNFLLIMIFLCRALDDQLMHVEASKKDAEIKLSSIGHTLRRIAGVQLDGTVTMPYRLTSPSRRYSPARGCSGDLHENRSLSCDNMIVDVDPELVRKGVRTLMHQVAQIERERVIYLNYIYPFLMD
jgi:rootletin